MGDRLWTGNHLGMQPVTKVNSAFYPSGVRKSSSTGLWLGLRRGVFTCVWWQVTPCYPIGQVTPHSCEMEFH